jgi:predicted NBD/HSP70 family sugar kinase
MGPVFQTITSAQMRGVNRSAILNLIRIQGPISRSKIASALQVSLPTVMRIVEELIEEDLVRLTGKKESSGAGRKRPLLEFNAHGHLVIGVDMGASCLHGALVDLSGEFIAERFIREHQLVGIAVYDRLVELIGDLLNKAQKTGKNLRGIGVAAAGITYYDEGVVQWAPSLDWRNFPLKQKLQDAFNLPVILDNDVNLSALGEMWFGEGQELNNLILIILGQGIGAGVIIDGRIYRGTHLAAGEIGFLLPDKGALAEHWEGVGAAESIAGIPGILTRAKSTLADLQPSAVNPSLSIEDVFKAYQIREPWAVHVVDETIDLLTQVVAAVSLCYDPDVIVLSGEMAKFSSILIGPILQRVEGCIPIQPRLVTSSLATHGAILGAVISVLHNTSEFYVIQQLQ